MGNDASTESPRGVRTQSPVTTCTQATKALSILRENKGGFDVVLTDVHIPGMNGIELLQLVGPEMDLAIVMMSADNSLDVMMTGIQHGASAYLVKPLHMEDLRIIWQHAVRKRQQVINEYPCITSVNDGLGESQRKKRDTNKNDVNLETGSSSSKKQRVVWSAELHQLFVNAVNQLGIDKAVPLKIRELMNVPGITRENVSSHLQKYRLYVKRIAEEAQKLGLIPRALFGVQSNTEAGSLARPNSSASTVSVNVPPQNPAALRPELLGQPSGGFSVPGKHQTVPQQTLVQVPNHISGDRGIAFTQPQMNLQTNIATESMPSFFSNYPSNNLSAVNSVCNLGGKVSYQNRSMPLQMVNRGSPLPLSGSSHAPDGYPSNNLGAVNSVCSLGGIVSYQNRSMPLQMVNRGSPLPLSRSSHALSTQPCLVLPSKASTNFMSQKFILVNQNSTAPPSLSTDYFHGGSNTGNMNQNAMVAVSQSQSIVQAGNYQLLSHSNKVPSNMGQHLDEGFTNIGVLNNYPVTGSTPSSVSPCTDSNANQPIMTPDFNFCQPNSCNIQDSGLAVGTSPNQGQGINLGSIANGTCMSTQYAVDHVQSPTNNMNKRINCTSDDENAEDFYSDFLDIFNLGA